MAWWAWWGKESPPGRKEILDSNLILKGVE